MSRYRTFSDRRGKKGHPSCLRPFDRPRVQEERTTGGKGPTGISRSRPISSFWALILIAALSLAVFANSLPNGFHFDDQHYVVENPFIRDLGNLPRFFESPRYSSFEVSFTGHYRPLVVSSYALNHSVGGLNPAGYRLVNLAFHICTAFLVFLIVREMMTSFGTGLALSPVARRGEPGGRGLPSEFPAWATGLIFAVHPFNSEVVDYITARSSVMCAFFYLLSLWCWIRYRERGIGERGSGAIPGCSTSDTRRPTRWYFLSLIAFLFAMLSKEVAITLPLSLWLFDRYFTDPPGSGWVKRILSGRAVLPLVPSIALVVIPYLLIRKFYYGALFPFEFARDFWVNLITQTHVLVRYLQMLFLPAGLTIEHDIHPVQGGGDPWTIFCTLILLSLLVVAVFLFRRGGEARLVSFFIVFFFVALLPTTLISLNAILQENRGYLAGSGFAVLVGVVLGGIGRWRWIGGVLSLTVLLGSYAWATVERNQVWKNDLTLWSDAARKAPRSARAHDNLGLAHFKRSEFPEAEKEFLEALRLNPRYFYAHYNLGVIYQMQERFPEAITMYRNATAVHPGFFRAYYNLGLAYKDMNRFEEAIGAYRKAVEIDSRHPFVYNNLGVVYQKTKDYQEAVRSFQMALALNPGYVKAYYNLGNLYLERGEYPEAAAAFREALNRQPDYDKARVGLRAAEEGLNRSKRGP